MTPRFQERKSQREIDIEEYEEALAKLIPIVLKAAIATALLVAIIKG